MGFLLIVGGLVLLGYPLVSSSPPEEEAASAQGSGGGVEQDSSAGEESLAGESPRGEGGFTLEEWQPMRLIVPTVDLDMEVITGGVFNEELLRKAPVHFEMSDLPSTEAGNVAVAAHRRGEAAFFRELDSLRPGDFIYLEVYGHVLVYRVVWNRIVEANDWSVIDSTPYPALTLQTCEPKDSPATHRLIVRANLYSFSSGLARP